jgi:hypothetical protein
MKHPCYFNLKVIAAGSLVICLILTSCSGIGDVDVKIKNGVPCFAITDKFFKRAKGEMVFSGIEVYDNKAGIIWGYHLLESIPLLENSCFLYGVLPEGAKVESGGNGMPLPGNVPPLKINTLYGIDMGASSLNSKDHIGYYRTDFCLQKDKDGHLIAQRVRDSCDNILPPE